MTMTSDVDTAAIQARVTKVLTDPKNEWPVIEKEPTTLEKLYKGYIIPLAAIPVIASFIGTVFIGVNMGFLGTYRTPIVRGVFWAIVSYVLALAAVYIAAFVVNKLAPTFQSQPSDTQSLKLVAYAETPVWIAGALHILPFLGALAGLIGGLYAIYLFYLGLPVMMKTPQDKVIPYMLVAAVVIIVLMFCVTVITGMIVGTGLATTGSL